MTTIVSIVGARPQFIKSSVLSRRFNNISNVNEVILHTGQHYDHNMSSSFFDDLGIESPVHYLGIGSGTHGLQTGRMLEVVEMELLKIKPSCVIVYGDTNSTLAGALAAVKMGIPVVHVEAGLRSFNMSMPEEINRVLVDRISSKLYAPTDNAVFNLGHEGVPPENIFMVGDIMYDAAIQFSDISRDQDCLDGYGLTKDHYILATVHRAYNTDNASRLISIFDGLIATGKRYKIILPLHPRTRAALMRCNYLDKVQNNIHIIPPVGYLDMQALERNSKMIVTDSGGVQKEAYFHGKACVILRDETEWSELLDFDHFMLIPPLTSDDVIDGIRDCLSAQISSHTKELYGGGHAGVHIVNDILKTYK